MDQQRFEAIARGFDKVRIAVVGDIFLDRIFYIERAWDELSVETGLVAYQVRDRLCVPGAAGVITNNLASLRTGARHALTVTGDDGEAFDLRKGLKQTGCGTDFMVAEEGRFTATYTKTFFAGHGTMEETNRIDLKNRARMAGETERRVIENLKELEARVDAIVCLEQIADGDCGVFTRPVIDALEEISLRGKVRVLVDSRFNLAKFRNMIVKCNDNEILRAAGIEAAFDGPFDEKRNRDVEAAMFALGADQRFAMFVSCGAQGIKVLSGGAVRTVAAYAVNGEIDICGAGDSALAGIACALCAGANEEEAALFGNLVASIIVEQIGVTGTATREQLEKRYGDYIEQRSV